MNNPLKIVLYVALVVLAGVSGFFALSGFGSLMARGADRTSALEQIEPERKASVDEATVGTNTVAASNTVETAVSTNNANGSTNAAAATNETPAITNGAAIAQANPPAGESTVKGNKTPGNAKSAQAKKTGSRLGLWSALFILSLVGLGLLIAADVSHYLGNKTLKVIYNDDGDGMRNPGYEEAEQLWADGKHLEAIGMMRDYLNKNPREQHVAIRIAEIYEKDLKNHLAAALEYEEVLKHKLAPDRWGWAAIHLCNLYFKLNQEQKGFELLRRIVNEHPTTAAAEKARKRLEQVDSSMLTPQLATESHVASATRADSAQSTTEGAVPGSNLPPGFRPKK